MEKDEEMKQILINIQNLVADIRTILFKTNNVELCPHLELSSEVTYYTSNTKGENFEVRQCLNCPTLVSVEVKKDE